MSSFVSAILKSIVTVELAAQILTQIRENCRRTISYLRGYCCPKLQLQETECSETYGEYSSQYKKNNFKLNAGKMNKHLFIKVTMYLSFSFRKKSQ